VTDTFDHNSADRRKWPGVSVLNGWIIFNGSTQMGFTLSLAWSPGEERSARGEHAREQVQNMDLPRAITEWLLNLFHDGLVASVTVQFAENRWRINIASPLNHLQTEEVVEIVDRLYVAANLPQGSPGERVAEVGAIRGDGSLYSEQDALAHWLGGRIQRAVQQIFAFSLG